MRSSLAAVTVVLAIAAWAGTASAVPPKPCGKVSVAGTKYLVIAHGVSCRFARKWVPLRLKKGRRAAPGFRCRKPSRGSNVKVQCTGRTKPKGDPLYRYYYGVKQ
jgi:hypothetical protein